MLPFGSLFIVLAVFGVVGLDRPQLGSRWRLKFSWPYQRVKPPSWLGFRRARHWGDELSLAEDEDTYEIDVMVIILLISVDITTIFISTFVDTNQTLAFKGAFISIIGIIGLAGMGFFGLIMFQKDIQVYTLRAGINYLAIGVGILGTSGLVLIQYAVFYVLLNGVALSSISATLNVDPATAALFYTSSAVNETFAFQGAMYVILVKLFAGFEEEVSWSDSLVASAIVASAAGLNHFAVYNAQPADILAVALGFFFLCFLFELTDSLACPLLAHIFLNLLSTSSGSIFGPPLAIIPASVAPVVSIAALIALLVLTAYAVRIARTRKSGRNHLAPVRASVQPTANSTEVGWLHTLKCQLWHTKSRLDRCEGYSTNQTQSTLVANAKLPLVQRQPSPVRCSKVVNIFVGGVPRNGEEKSTVRITEASREIEAEDTSMSAGSLSRN